MSRATKRKYVIKELLESEIKLPEVNEILCRIIMSRGNNLHEVETSNNEIFLASMPSKFRHNIWIKRGDFVLLERIQEGDKVKGEISKVLTRDHIKFFKSQGIWPEKFDSNYRNNIQQSENIPSCCSSSSDSDSDENSDKNDNVDSKSET
ncbi:putative RNA-binding protein EIF1AD [Lycorma delicatula]|uniref:putative RNA-binding protein EIF1AD n=1 Tax=Lycorma delicatula TaxID=130591 RepID=UPI003F50DD9A